jgi:hypothetical protein
MVSSHTTYRPCRDADLKMSEKHVQDSLTGAALNFADGNEQGIEWLGM